MVKKTEEARDGLAGVGGVWKLSSEQQGTDTPKTSLWNSYCGVK